MDLPNRATPTPSGVYSQVAAQRPIQTSHTFTTEPISEHIIAVWEADGGSELRCPVSETSTAQKLNQPDPYKYAETIDNYRKQMRFCFAKVILVSHTNVIAAHLLVNVTH